MKYTAFTITIIVAISCNLSKSAYKLKKDKLATTYANTITAAELETHLKVIASDEYEGRETGKKGQRMTAEYLKNEFIKDGVAPGNKGSYFQNYPLIETSAPQATFKFRNKTFSSGEDFYFFNRYANFQSMEISHVNIFDAGYGIKEGDKNDFGNKLSGKVVFIKAESPKEFKSWNWRKKLAAAKESGALAVFFTSDKFNLNNEKYHHMLNSPSLSLESKSTKGKSDEIPFFFISDRFYTTVFMEVGEPIEEKVLNNPFYNSIVFDYISTTKKIESSNVLGFIEGSDDKLKNEIIIVTAHYDHLGIKDGLVYNGADDDGTGTVALLELAEAFQKAKNDGNGPKRSILIMPVSGEEKGLLGSKYYAENPIYPLANTVVDLNIDMIGRLDENHNKGNYVYLIGADKISQELNDISEASNNTYTKLNLDYTFNDENDPNRFYYRSDHYNFVEKGIPVIFYFSGVHEDYHKHTDVVEKIMFDKVEKITKLVFYTAWEVANKPSRLKLNE